MTDPYTHLSLYVYSLTGCCVPTSVDFNRTCARPITDPDAFGSLERSSYRPPVKVRALVVTQERFECTIDVATVLESR